MARLTKAQRKRLKTIVIPEREPNGRHQRVTTVREREEPVTAVALAQPHRQILGPKYADDSRITSPLGVLHITKAISTAQYEAGKYYAGFRHRYARIRGPSLPHISSVLNERHGGSGKDPTDEIVADLRDEENLVTGAVMNTNEYEPAMRVLYRVCVLDKMPMGERELGTLRNALNCLDRMRRKYA